MSRGRMLAALAAENVNENRSVSRAYFLINSTGEELRVCLKFFCATFAVSTRMIQYTMQNTSRCQASI